jgi:hypothetical protein
MVNGRAVIMNFKKIEFWVCGKLGKSHSPPNKGIKRFQDSHSVWGRRRKKSNMFKHPPPF